MDSPARCPASVFCQTPPGGLNPAAYVTVATIMASSKSWGAMTERRCLKASMTLCQAGSNTVKN
uniref:Uncharacterized protein n=1 Tax=Oryza glumipatula TaxID=40148 RepID=A0A0E0A8E2_9ORYZ